MFSAKGNPIYILFNPWCPSKFFRFGNVMRTLNQFICVILCILAVPSGCAFVITVIIIMPLESSTLILNSGTV